MERKKKVICLLLMYVYVTQIMKCFGQTDEMDFQNLINFNDSLYTIMAYCPFTRSCRNKNEHYNEILEQSFIDGKCCVPCDCSDSCFLKGNCCHDKEETRKKIFLHSNLTKNRSCVHTFNDINPFSSSVSPFFNTSYLLHQYCLEEGTDAARKCLDPNGTKMDETSPVYLQRTGLNYRNIFCLECIGESSTNAEYWPARIHCTDTYDPFLLRNLLSKNREEANENFLQQAQEIGCAINYDPIHPQTAEWCVHPNDVISSCNPLYDMTVLWYNETKRLCESDSPDEIHYVPIVMDEQIFKNIYCAACNTLPKSPVLMETDNCSAYVFNFEDGSFVSLLNSNAYLVPRQEITESNCYVEFEAQEGNVCVYDSCPLTDLRVADRCMPLMTKIQGFCLDYRLTISFPLKEGQVPLNEQLKEELFHGALSDIEGETIENNLVYDKVENTSFSNEGTFDMSMILLRKINDIVEVKYLYDNFMRKLDQFNAKIAGSNVKYNTKLRPLGFEPITGKFKDMAVFSNHDEEHAYSCNIVYAMAKIQTCPAVETSSFTPLEEKKIQVGQLVFEAYEYVLITASDGRSDVVHICKDTFDMKMNLSKKAANAGCSLNFEHVVIRNVILMFFCTFTPTLISLYNG